MSMALRFTGPPWGVPNTLGMTAAAARVADDATDFLTVAQAAELFPALGRRFVQRLADERRVPVFRVGPRRILLRKTDLLALIENGRQGPETI